MSDTIGGIVRASAKMIQSSECGGCSFCDVTASPSVAEIKGSKTLVVRICWACMKCILDTVPDPDSAVWI